MNAFDYFFEQTYQLDKPFLVGQENASFIELYNSSIILATYLRREFGENKNILLVSPNNLFFLKAYLAILKSGNVCIPLDPNIEKKNFDYIYNLTNPCVIFVVNEIGEKLQIPISRCIHPETILVNEKEKIILKFEENYNDENCAEIIFTSGSTGKPKGVMISHKNIISNSTSIIKYLQLRSSDRMLVVLPFFYCYGLSLLHTHLRIGGSIILNNSFIFLGTIINNLIDYKCTGFAGVPSHFQILLRKSDSFKRSQFSDLRYVTQAGGKLPEVFIDEFCEYHPEIQFYVMYGQTEATARLSYLPPELIDKKKGSIGKGIPGLELKVVNQKGEKVKPGETGEITAHGENIMMGYYEDKEETQLVLKDGWLYTGDLATVDEDDYIYITARKKEIVKVGGKRINPKEIESVIFALPEVVDCIIEGVEDELLGEAIKATIVIKSENENKLTIDRIKEHCSNYLALHKIPQIIELKVQLTMSSTGKKVKGQL